jgi:hypothetical protein
MATSRRRVSLQQRNTVQDGAEETTDDLNLTIERYPLQIPKLTAKLL